MKSRVRLIILALALLSIIILGRLTDLGERFQIEELQQLVESAGTWGYIVYVVIFIAGGFIHIPGVVLISLAAVAFGGAEGLFIAIAGSIACVTFSFLAVRFIGGTPFAELKAPPIVRRLLSRLDAKPVRTIILLRTIVWVAPPLNYALALSAVTFRDYFVGSALGLLLPVSVIIACSELIIT